MTKAFEKIKSFFIERINKLVHYKVITKEEIREKGARAEKVIKEIINNPLACDYFAIEFPYSADNGLVCIDSLDSFVFDFYFVDLGDIIVLSDGGRTFECGVEAFEGNGVIAKETAAVERYLTKNGMVLNDGVITKTVNEQSFERDTIVFIKALQTLNNAQPYPPYILELDTAKETVDALSSAWIKGESVEDEKGSREVALFDNHKTLCENQTCFECEYTDYFNKHYFIGAFFNGKGELLARKTVDGQNPVYDFAIADFVLNGEQYSLEALQRAVRESFGLELLFGEIAPALTTVKNKIITDYYVITDYEVTLDEIKHGNNGFTFEWLDKESVIALAKNGNFSSHPLKLIEYIFDIDE